MIDLYSSSSNLGDNLSLTPLMRATPCRVHLIDDQAVRSTAPIFDGLGEVVFDNVDRLASPEAAIRGPHSRKTLAQFGFLSHDPIPKITLSDDEISRARTMLSELPNPCIIKSTTAKRSGRTPPPELIQQIVDLNPGTTFLTTCLSPNHIKHNLDYIPIRGVFPLWDLPVRQIAAIYHVIGRYIGPDTGDYHLMLAVGGVADVLIPESSPEYDYGNFLYDDTCWSDKRRVQYHRWAAPLHGSITGLNLSAS